MGGKKSKLPVKEDSSRWQNPSHMKDADPSYCNNEAYWRHRQQRGYIYLQQGVGQDYQDASNHDQPQEKHLKSKKKSEKKKKKNDKKPNKSKHASVSEISDSNKQKPKRKDEVHTTKQDHRGSGTKMKNGSHDRVSESASGWSRPNERNNLDYHESLRALQREGPPTPFSTSLSGNRKEDVDQELKQMNELLSRKEEEIHSIRERLSRTNEELHGVRQDLNNTRRELDENKRKYEEDLGRQTEKIKRLEADKNDIMNRQDLENIRRESDKKIKKYEEDLERKTEKIKRLEADMNDLLNRISSESSARMTYNNPNITDLSDQNRPTKIAERYTELYDNEWTDAFQNLQQSYQLSDTKAIHLLLDVLYISFDVCKQIQEKREALVRNITEYVGEAGRDVIIFEVMTVLKGAQKNSFAKMQKDYAKKVQEVLERKYSSMLQCIGPYVNECVELCLLMNIQYPALELRGVVLDENQSFDVAVFRPYTKSGSRIEHMVWPALYLYKNGPLLCRGVAQGTRNSPE